MQNTSEQQSDTTTQTSSSQNKMNKNGGLKTGVIIYLVMNILFLLLVIWLLYRGFNDDPTCLSKIPLIVISIIWLVSILIQLAGSSWLLYVLNK